MGKRGPSPTPTALKKLRGNPGKRTLPKAEPQPTTGAPQCPEWLGEIAKQYWHEAIQHMPPGIITKVDGQALAQYCDAWQTYRLNREVVYAEGWFLQTVEGKTYSHPAVKHMNEAATKIHKFAREFGFTPSARVGLTVPEKEQEDPLLTMLKERAGNN